MAKIAQTNQTPETTKNYLARARNLLVSIPDSFMSDPEAGFAPDEIVAWFKQTAPGLRKSSFRQYKASLACHMKNEANNCRDQDSAKVYLAGAAAILAVSGQIAAARKSIPDRTSSNKTKFVHLEDMAKLGQFMMNSNSRWNMKSYTWLAAGIASGLRPAEWETAEIISHANAGGITLKVKNAKNTNGRACGEFREVAIPAGWMSDYSEKHLLSLQSWLKDGNSYEAYYSSSRLALNRAVRALWPNNDKKRYSLYSARHQFCSNLKRSGIEAEEIAQLMGHGSVETMKSTYGKRRSGYSSFSPKTGATPTPGPDVLPDIKSDKPGI